MHRQMLKGDLKSADKFIMIMVFKKFLSACFQKNFKAGILVDIHEMSA